MIWRVQHAFDALPAMCVTYIVGKETECIRVKENLQQAKAEVFIWI